MWTVIVIVAIVAGIAYWLHRSFNRADGVDTTPEKIVDAVKPVWGDTVAEVKEAAVEISAPSRQAGAEVAGIVKDDVEVLVDGAKASVEVVTAYTDALADGAKDAVAKAKKAAADKKAEAKAKAAEKAAGKKKAASKKKAAAKKK